MREERRTPMDETMCCPKFDPEPWDRREIVWRDRLFVKDRVRSVFHIPLNFGAVMKRNMARIEAAGAQPKPEEMLVLSDDNSLWGADVYITVTREVPDCRMARLSGTFLCRVFEGPFSNTGKWMREMVEYVRGKGRSLERVFFYYTACPKCAKKYGKNYVALLARVATE